MGEIIHFRKSSHSYRPDGSLLNFRPESQKPTTNSISHEGIVIDQTVFEAKKNRFRSDIYCLTQEDFPFIDVASPLSWESHE